MARPQSGRETLRLLLGRWGVLRDPPGDGAPRYPGDYRRRRAGPQRTRRALGWLPGERAVLEGPASRSQKPRARARPRLGHRGWSLGVLEGAPPGIWTDPRTTVLGA